MSNKKKNPSIFSYVLKNFCLTVVYCVLVVATLVITFFQKDIGNTSVNLYVIFAIVSFFVIIISYFDNNLKYYKYILTIIDKKIFTISFEKQDLINDWDETSKYFYDRLKKNTQDLETQKLDEKDALLIINSVLQRLILIKEKIENPFFYKFGLPIFSFYVSILAILVSLEKNNQGDTYIFVYVMILVMMISIIWIHIPDICKNFHFYKDFSNNSFKEEIEVRLSYMNILNESYKQKILI